METSLFLLTTRKWFYVWRTNNLRSGSITQGYKMKIISYKLHRPVFLFLLALVFSGPGFRAQSYSITITPSVQCFNGPGATTAFATVTTTVGGITSFSWSAVSGSCAPSFSPSPTGSFVTISYPCCGSYVFTCTAYSGASPVNNIPAPSSVLCPPVISITGNNNVCPGNSATLTASGAVTYTWSNSSPFSSIVVSPTTTTCYSVIGTNASGCSALASSCLSVQPVTVANFNYSVNANGNVTFTSTSTPTTALSSYTWNFGNGSPPVVSGPVNTVSATYTSNGVYVATLSFSSGSICPGIATATASIVVSTASCILNANFSSTQGSNGLVNFTNLSTGTSTNVSYTWAFGDNTLGFTTSPAHTYSANGTYTVKLVANNNTPPFCLDSVFIPVTVSSYSVPCNAGFSYSLGSAGNVTFTSTSTGVNSLTTYYWNFGSSTFSATGVAGVIASTNYSANGIYSVNLTIVSSAPSCSSAITNTINVNNVSGCSLVANFVTQYVTSSLVTFSSTSTGTVAGSSFSWNYGDSGTGSGTVSTHFYSSSGTYIATLTVNNNTTPACISTKTLAITINTLCNIGANFTHTVGSAGTVTFSSNSSTLSSHPGFYWNFGDGVFSTAANPVHTFTNAGTYTVSFILSDTANTFCKDTLIQSLNVTGIPCIANSNFTLVPTNTPQFWNAIPANPWNVVAATWMWGDGGSNNTLFASHLYSVSGTYSICLSVTVSCGASSTYCYPYTVFKSTEGPSNVISINVVAPELSTNVVELTRDNWTFMVYPNPNPGSFTLKGEDLEKKGLSIVVYDLLGKEIYKGESAANDGLFEKNIQLGDVSGGFYFIELRSASKTLTQKIIVSK